MLKLFTRKACSKCPPAKEICTALHEKGFEVVFLDVDTPAGRDEVARHGVKALPTTILLDNAGNEMLSWRGNVPDKNVLDALANQG